jgi:hypothetical protein
MIDNMMAIRVLMPQELQSASSTTMNFHQSKNLLNFSFEFLLSGPWCARSFGAQQTDDVQNSDGVESATSNCTTESELRSSREGNTERLLGCKFRIGITGVAIRSEGEFVQCRSEHLLATGYEEF